MPTFWMLLNLGQSSQQNNKTTLEIHVQWHDKVEVCEFKHDNKMKQVGQENHAIFWWICCESERVLAV